MLIRKTSLADIESIGKIYASAKEFMRNAGNTKQWSDGYPGEDSALSDMQNGIGYVCEDRGEIVAVFAFKIGNEPTYDRIFNGRWQTDEPYAFIHRIAVKKHGKGIVDFCFSECFRMFKNLKIDTHKDNIPMQKVLLRNGFQYCGIIYLENGEERLAFQKT